MSCIHKDFQAQVQVLTNEDTSQRYALVQVRCAHCGLHFEFCGLPEGDFGLAQHPVTRNAGKELHVPIVPYGETRAKLEAVQPKGLVN